MMEWKALDQRLAETEKELAQASSLRARQESLQKKRMELLKREWELRKQREEEQRDVETLEGPSLTAFAARLRGTYEEKKEKEEREAREAAARHQAAERELAEADRELEQLNGRLHRLEDLNREYEELLRQKAELLLTRAPQQAQTLKKMDEAISDLAGREKELWEAINAGKACLRKTEEITEKLNSAASWGTFDIVAGGIVSSMAKHEKLDGAGQLAEELSRLLSWFRRELADVESFEVPQIRMDGFTRFADIFFDNIFTDLAVQNRIRQSQSEIASVASQINRILGSLQEQERAVRAQRQMHEEQRRQWLVSAREETAME